MKEKVIVETLKTLLFLKPKPPIIPQVNTKKRLVILKTLNILLFLNPKPLKIQVK